MNTYNEPGKGRKQCPTCKIFVAARSHECICGHQFQPKEHETPTTTTTTTQETPEEPKQYHLPLIYAEGRGAGNRYAPPKPPTTLTPEGIRDWIENAQHHAQNHGMQYAPQALRQMAQQTWSRFKTDGQPNPDYHTAVTLINEALTNQEAF